MCKPLHNNIAHLLFEDLGQVTYFQCADVLLQEVLYVGDHIFGDIIKSKKEQAFRSHNMHDLDFSGTNGPGLTMCLTFPFPFQDIPCHSRTDIRNRFMGRAFRSRLFCLFAVCVRQGGRENVLFIK